MGVLKTLRATDGQTAGSAQLDRDTAAILVRRLSDRPLGGQLDEEAGEDISLSIRYQNGEIIDLIKRVPLGQLAAFGQHMVAGPVREIFTDGASQTYARACTDLEPTADRVAVPTGGKYLALFMIRLTGDGLCIPIGSDDKATFHVENMYAGAVYDIVAIEGFQTGSNYLFYDSYTLTNDVHEKDIDVDNMAGLVLPATNAWKRFLITYGTGKTAKYDLPELKQKSADANLIEQQLIHYSQDGNEQFMTTVSHGPLTSDLLVVPLKLMVRINIEKDNSELSFLQVRVRSFNSRY